MGTVGWIVARTTPSTTPIVELQSLLYSVVGVSLLTGFMLHYLLWSFPLSERRSLVLNIEVVVAGIATIEVTVQTYFTIGIGSEQLDRLPYVLLLPQFINVFVSLYYSTLWLLAGAHYLNARRRRRAAARPLTPAALASAEEQTSPGD